MISQTVIDSHSDVDESLAMTGTLPLVTIVIPVYNRLQYLEQAIRSALCQTHSRIEVIVVDDGSPLDPSTIVAWYQDRVRLIRKSNGGLASARNAGAAQAHGDYLLFLDDDDFLEPEAVERLLQAIRENHGACWAAGRFWYADDSGPIGPGRESLHFESGDIYQRMIHQCLISCPSSVLVRADVLRNLGLFDETMRLSEDYDMWLRIARDYPIAATPAHVTNYRLHSQQISRTQWTRHFDHHLEVIRKHRIRSRPGFDHHFKAARADLHLRYGDGLYVDGENAQARAQWRLAIAAGEPALRPAMIGRFAKSYLPGPVLKTLRRFAARVRTSVRGSKRETRNSQTVHTV